MTATTHQTGAGPSSIPSTGVHIGVKQTDLGTIPVDWNIVQIGDLNPFVTSGSRGWARFYSDTGAPFIRMTNLSRESIDLDLSDLRFVVLPLEAAAEASRTQLQNGDVLISITADIGIIGFVDASIPKPVYINQHMALIRLPEPICSRFVAYSLASERPQKLFAASMDIGAKAGMNLSTVRKLRLALPSPSEQRAIAQALSDVDDLIRALDRLIAKKRAIKQAAMQQLLTGKTRLPGFSGEWETKRLGDVLKVHHGRTQSGIVVPDGRYPILGSGGEVGRTDTPLYDKPSVLIGRKGTIDEPQFAAAPFWTIDTLFFTEISADVDARFMFYKFCMIPWKSYNEASGVPSLSARTIEGITISMAGKAEQIAIATALSDMDAEIAALERRRDKTKQIKQGMMQQLLTGRIRLVEPGPAQQVEEGS